MFKGYANDMFQVEKQIPRAVKFIHVRF